MAAARDVRDFYFNPANDGFYYRPTGDRWVAATIRSLFTPEQIARIKRQTAPPPEKLAGFSRKRSW
jgi:hypothetical protein